MIPPMTPDGFIIPFAWLPIQGLFWKTEYRFYDSKAGDVPLFYINDCCRDDFLNNRKFVQTIRTELVWRFNFGNWGAPVAARY